MDSSASSDTARFCVVVYAAPDDPQELGDVLERVLGLHPTDALVQARTAPGPLTADLPRETAERLAAEISQIGVRAEAVPAESVPEFKNIVVVHHARCLDSGLEVLGLSAQERTLVPWNDIDLISVGQIPQETARHYLT